MSFYIIAMGVAVELGTLLLALSLCRVAAQADQQRAQFVPERQERV